MVSKVVLKKSGRLAELLEPVEEVVGQEQEIEISLVGMESCCGGGLQSIVFLDLSRPSFHRGPPFVEGPDLLGS